MVNNYCLGTMESQEKLVRGQPELRDALQIMMDDDFKNFLCRHRGQSYCHETQDRQALWSPPRLPKPPKAAPDSGNAEELQIVERESGTEVNEEDITHD